MSIHRIPIHELSPEALQCVVEEFISRDGTDYGAIKVPTETKFKQVKYKLARGLAVLIFDDAAETTNLFMADDPMLKKILWSLLQKEG
ncbi:MAG: YheU family protein [Pseudomonadota bacterium]